MTTTVHVDGALTAQVHLDLTGLDVHGKDRQVWLDARRAGIGSSDAPAVCRLDSYRSPFNVYVDKLGELDEVEDNDAMEWGRRLEQVIGEKAAETLGATLIKPTAMYRHPDHAWQLASPDFFVRFPSGQIGIVEAKTTSKWRADEWEGGAPARVQVQVQHQHAVLGTRDGWVARLIDGRNFALVPCHRDDEAIAELARIEADFWDRVVRREAPDIDGTDSTREALEALYAAVGDTDIEVEIATTALEWAAEIRRLNGVIKGAERAREEYRNLLRAEIGDATVATVDGTPVATWKWQHRDGHTVDPSDFRVLRLAGARK